MLRIFLTIRTQVILITNSTSIPNAFYRLAFTILTLSIKMLYYISIIIYLIDIIKQVLFSFYYIFFWNLKYRILFDKWMIV